MAMRPGKNERAADDRDEPVLNNTEATPLTRQNIIDVINALRARSVEPFAIVALDPPAISPRLLPDLEERGYVEGDRWTLAGLEWLYGIPSAGNRDE